MSIQIKYWIRSILVFSVLASCNNDNGNEIDSSPKEAPIYKAAISNNQIDFDRGFIGEIYDSSFTIENSGNEILNISEIVNDEDDFKISHSSSKINVGETLKFKVNFRPSKKKQYSTLVIIKLKEEEILNFKITLNANVNCDLVTKINYPVSYNSHIKSILANCTLSSCHNAETKRAGYSFLNYEEAKENFKGTSFHDPISQVENGLMPPRNPLC